MIKEKYNVIVTAGLSDYKLQTKIIGLVNNENIQNIYLIRKLPLHNFGVKIVNINPNYLIKYIPIFYEIWRIITAIFLIKRNNIFAIIGIQLVFHGTSAVLIGKLTKTRTIACPIGTDIHSHLNNYFYNRPIKWALKNANMLTYLGSRSKNILNNLGIPDIKLVEIRNYHDPNLFKLKPSNARNKWDLIYIGRLIQSKNIELIIHAVSFLLDENINIKLAIAGNGPKYHPLKELSNKLKVSDQISFLGERNDIESLLHQSHALVLASNVEALPAVALEAMHCGVPSILTEISDIPDVFKNGYNSSLIPKNDLNALANSIIMLLNDKSYYQTLVNGCLNSRNDYQSNWNLDKQASKWNDLLHIH